MAMAMPVVPKRPGISQLSVKITPMRQLKVQLQFRSESSRQVANGASGNRDRFAAGDIRAIKSGVGREHAALRRQQEAQLDAAKDMIGFFKHELG